MIPSNLGQIHALRLAGLEITGLSAVLAPREAPKSRYVHFPDGEPIEDDAPREKPVQPVARRGRGTIPALMLEALRGADWINGPEIARRAECTQHSVYHWLPELLSQGKIEHDGHGWNRLYRLKRTG